MAAAFTAGPAVAAGTTSAEAVGWLNAQRSANGIPAGIVDKPAWDVGCQHHVEWLAKHLDLVGLAEHYETPGSSGYTEDGAWAGEHSDLGGSFLPDDSASLGLPRFNTEYPWGADNGWEWAPLHLMALLAPSLAVSGFWPGCMVVDGEPERPPPSTPRLFTYPGAGTSFIYPSEDAEEVPFTPGQFVGFPQGTVTGPYLYVLPWGAGAGSLTAATLSGPGGPVAVVTVDDNTNSRVADLAAYMRPGGMIIPRKPLLPYSHYTASATFVPNGGQAMSIRWSFATGPMPNNVFISYASEPKARRGRYATAFDVGTVAPHATFTLTGPHGSRLRPRLYATGTESGTGHNGVQYDALVRLTAGSWLACASSGGKPSLFAVARHCQEFRIGAHAHR